MTNIFGIYYVNKTRRYFEENTWVRFFVALAMLIIMFLVAFTIFYVTKIGLESTQQETDAFMRQAVPLYIYEIFLLIVGFLIFISAVIFGLFNFFKDENDDWIMASPSYWKLPFVKFIRAIINSSWPVIIMLIPLLLALKSVFGYSFGSFLLALISVLSFSLFSASCAIVLLFCTAPLVKLFKQKSFKFMAFIMAVFILFSGILVWIRAIAVDLNELFQVKETTTPVLTGMIENFSIFPSHLSAMTLFYLQQGEITFALQQTSIIFLLAMFTFLFFYFLSGRFLYMWQSFQEGEFEAKNEKSSSRSKFLSRFYPKNPEDVITKKELLVGLRSTKNIFWILFLMVPLVVQIGIINLFVRYSNVGNVDESILKEVLPSLQMGIVLYFICAFILRFVFPSFSQEGETSWILGAAPINLKNVFWSKYKFFAVLMSLISTFVLLIYIFSMPLDVLLAILLIFATLIAVLTLTMVGLSFGFIFVNFKTNDPNILSTSAPGIGFTIISLAYSILGAYLFYWTLSMPNYLPLLFFIVISIVLGKIFSKAALKSLENIEFI